MFRNQTQWIVEYQIREALWMHDGKPSRPHARLTSGKCSGGFFNSKLVITDEELLHEAASDLLELFIQQGGDLNQIDGVVGPQTGATKFAELLAALITKLTGRPCFWVSPAKIGEGRQRSMVFNVEDYAKLAGKAILLCDDVITTAESVELAAKASINAGAKVLPFILALVNRSGLEVVYVRKIIGLITRHLPIWEPAECPLCLQGSAALRPKEGENWKLLNAQH